MISNIDLQYSQRRNILWSWFCTVKSDNCRNLSRGPAGGYCPVKWFLNFKSQIENVENKMAGATDDAHLILDEDIRSADSGLVQALANASTQFPKQVFFIFPRIK